ncbi:MAG: hypothetical protein P8R42_14920 [Candidatus Binatia bacterium]|nr:hypothetical protein [Candidatus Binatia bacterium]
MSEERADEYYVERLLSRVKLVVATDDDIPIETKLETQPMLKEFIQTLSYPPDQQDQGRAIGQHQFLLDALDDYPNCTALLTALRNFVPYL